MTSHSNMLPAQKKKAYVRPTVKVFRCSEPTALESPDFSEWLDRIATRLLDRHRRPEATADLAIEIAAYGRMRAVVREPVFIEVPLVAFQLSESSRHVRQSLRLLQSAGIVKATRSKNHWRLVA